jgi:hypothetical protein
MAIASSGEISLTTVQTEFGGSPPIAMSEYYAGAGLVGAGTTGTLGAVPSSGAISLGNFYGTSNVVAPQNTVAPSLSGNSVTGQVMTTSNGSWNNITGTNLATASYQWKRDGSTNIGTNANTYTLVDADLGYDVTCVVTFTNAAGAVSATTSNKAFTNGPLTTTSGSQAIAAGVEYMNLRILAQQGDAGGPASWNLVGVSNTNHHTYGNIYPLTYPSGPASHGSQAPASPSGNVFTDYGPISGYTIYTGFWLGIGSPPAISGTPSQATVKVYDGQPGGSNQSYQANGQASSTQGSLTQTQIRLPGISQNMTWTLGGPSGSRTGGSIRYGHLR